jgi:hypothetical protein
VVNRLRSTLQQAAADELENLAKSQARAEAQANENALADRVKARVRKVVKRAIQRCEARHMARHRPTFFTGAGSERVMHMPKCHDPLFRNGKLLEANI